MADEIAQIEKQIAGDRKSIKTQQAEFTEARKNLSTPIRAPTLTMKELINSTRLQRAQIKGMIGVAERQRKSSLGQLGSAQKTFNKEVAALESSFRTTESQIKSYRIGVAKQNKENAEWAAAQRIVKKGGRSLGLERKYGSPTLKSKIRKLLESGTQSIKQEAQGLYPTEVLELYNKGVQAFQSRNPQSQGQGFSSQYTDQGQGFSSQYTDQGFSTQYPIKKKLIITPKNVNVMPIKKPQQGFSSRYNQPKPQGFSSKYDLPPPVKKPKINILPIVVNPFRTVQTKSQNQTIQSSQSISPTKLKEVSFLDKKKPQFRIW